MKDYTRNNTLYSRLLAAAREDKLPILDNKTFESMNAEYGKEEMRKILPIILQQKDLYFR